MKEKKYYLPAVCVSKTVYIWLKKLAKDQDRSVTKQLIRELKKLAGEE